MISTCLRHPLFKRQLTVVLFFHFSLFYAPVYAHTCTDLFRVPYWNGYPEESLSSVYVTSVLGTGEMGGTVRRITHTQKKYSELEKDYYDPTQLLSDVAALKILQTLSLETANRNVTIIQPKRISGEHLLYFEDIRGFALDRLPSYLDSPHREQQFNSWSKEIFEISQKKENFDTEELETGFWISYRVPLTERKKYFGLSVIDIFLKPDNVIYDTVSRRLVIFDPY